MGVVRAISIHVPLARTYLHDLTYLPKRLGVKSAFCSASCTQLEILLLWKIKEWIKNGQMAALVHQYPYQNTSLPYQNTSSYFSAQNFKIYIPIHIVYYGLFSLYFRVFQSRFYSINLLLPAEAFRKPLKLGTLPPWLTVPPSIFLCLDQLPNLSINFSLLVNLHVISISLILFLF